MAVAVASGATAGQGKRGDHWQYFGIGPLGLCNAVCITVPGVGVFTADGLSNNEKRDLVSNTNNGNIWLWLRKIHIGVSNALHLMVLFQLGEKFIACRFKSCVQKCTPESFASFFRWWELFDFFLVEAV